MKFKIQRDKSLTEHYRSSKPISILDVFIIALLLAAIILCCVFSIPSSQGETAVIYHSGSLIGRYSLSKDTTIELLNGKMTFSIRSGKASIIYSDCPNSICIHTGDISKSGERIVCAPNKITVLIEGDEKAIITGGEA